MVRSAETVVVDHPPQDVYRFVADLRNEVRPLPAHADGGVGGGHGGGVVDAVSHEQHPVPGGFELVDLRHFVRRQQLALRVGDSHLGAEPVCGALVGAREQQRAVAVTCFRAATLPVASSRTRS